MWKVGEASTCPHTAPSQHLCTSQPFLGPGPPRVGPASGDRATACFLSVLRGGGMSCGALWTVVRARSGRESTVCGSNPHCLSLDV